jgi:hypothetical protein
LAGWCGLAAAVSAPRRHTICDVGVLGAASSLLSRVVPAPPVPAGDVASAAPQPAPRPGSPRPRCRYRPLLELLARTFGDDRANCQACGGAMKWSPSSKVRPRSGGFLAGIGQPTDPPPLAPAVDRRALRGRAHVTAPVLLLVPRPEPSTIPHE